MKVLVTCVIEIDPARRDLALRDAAPLIAMARVEPGCLAYNWGADLNQDNRIYVYEEWESKEALAQHFEAPSFFGISEHLGKFGLQGATARKYLIEKESPIYDDQGNVRADFF